MNFEDLFTIKNKLEEIYKKLETIDQNQYDSKEIRMAFNTIDKYIDKYNNVSNSLSSPTEALTQDKTIASLLKLTNSLESYVDSIYSSFRIFDDVKKIEDLMSRKIISKEETKESVQIILNDLIDYNKLDKQGNFISPRYENELVPTFYKLIKAETKYTGNSTLLDALERMKLDTLSLNKRLINEAFSIGEYNFASSVLNSTSKHSSKINRDLLLRVSINNDNFEKDVIEEYSKKKDALERDKDNYNEILKERKEITGNNKKRLRKAKKRVAKRIIPLVLSATILIGSNVALGIATKGYSKKTGTTYSTLDGVYDYEDHNRLKLKEGDVLIEYYSGTRTDGKREFRRYIIPEEDVDKVFDGNIIPTEEANNTLIEPSDEYLVKKDNNYDTNGVVAFEFTNVTSIEKVEKDLMTYFPLIALHILIVLLWVIVDMILSGNSPHFTCLLPSKDGLFENLDDIKEAIKRLKDVEYEIYTNNDKNYTKEKLLELKTRIKEEQKEYDDFMKEYSYMEKYLNKYPNMKKILKK